MDWTPERLRTRIARTETQLQRLALRPCDEHSKWMRATLLRDLAEKRALLDNLELGQGDHSPR